AAQLEPTPASTRKNKQQNDTRLSPLYSNAGPTSSTSDFEHSPSSYASSTSPLTPATPWTAEDSSDSTKAGKSEQVRGNETGLGLSGMSSGKLSGRGGVSKARAEPEEDELDDELEDELNDFGYGSRVARKKEKKESLLDMLNSEPPSWMTEAEPVPVSLPRKGSLPSKIRKKFSSSAIDNDLQANFSTLQRGGSKSRKEDTSPLRSSRSAGNLLNSFRSRTNNFGFKISGGGGSSNRSRENLQGSIDLGSQSSHSKNGLRMLDEEEFERLINVPTSTRRLTAKDGVSSSPATRDLADFLRSNGPPFEKSKSSVSLATTEASSVLTNSTNARSFGSLEDTRIGGGGGGTDNPSIVRAAMVKLGAAGRRASLGTSTSFQNLVNSNRPSTSSGIPRLSPTQSKLKRPSTAQTVASQESAYDPLNKEMIQVDDSLMRGMFGGPREKDMMKSKGEEEEERLRDSQVEVGTPLLGVYEFVAIDERESGGKSPELHRLGSLTKSKSLGNVSNVRRPSSSSGSNSSSTTKLPSPRRKPVPLADNSSSLIPSPSRPIRTSSNSKLRALPERDDTSPFSTGESPVKGALPSPSPVRSLSSAPFSSLVPTSEVKTPTTPYEMYSTPPLTPATPSPVKLPSTSPKHRKRETSAQSQLDNNPSSLPPASPLPRVPDSRSSSQTSSRKDAFRPRSMLLQPSESVSKRLSSLSTLETNEKDSSTPAPPMHLPPPSTPIDEPVIAALDSLRMCMSQTANLPLNSTSIEELVPTLRGLQQSMEHSSKLLGAILARLDGQRETKEEEEGKLVAMLLGAEEWDSEGAEDNKPVQKVPPIDGDGLDGESMRKTEEAVQA
ncbi:hypothetical protein JCM3765_007664, partial [Sporobolomyces pararoseus]